ncbi:hypothetical protein KY362_04360 [Candidatus Woesearchaeota archaeon]|nr:hypothetical protein [Candidatus Woesearchaeota archaeon]
MKKTISIIFLLSVVGMLMLTGCGKDDAQGDVSNALVKKAQQKEKEIAVEQAEDAREEAAHKVSQELVNFECEIQGVQTLYFLKGDIKIESSAPGGMREAWLIGDKYYTKMEIGGEDLLVEWPSDESEVDAESMMDTYAMSKSVPNIDCKLGTVSQSKVKLPDLEIIDNEEMGTRMMGDFESEIDAMYADMDYEEME